MRIAVTRRRRRRRRPWRSTSTSAGPSRWVYKGSENPGGGRSHQSLDTSCRAPSPRQHRPSRFFGGSGWGPSRGAFPFSSAENRRIGAIAARLARTEKKEKQEEMDWKGTCRSVLIAGGGQPPASTIAGNHDPLCMQGLVSSRSCRGVVGERSRPRPINRHAAPKAAGC